MNKQQYEKLRCLPSTNSLLKVSLGLMFLTMFSFVMIYAETTSVNVNEHSFDIEYAATGMTISTVESDVDFVSLIFDVDVTASSAILDVTFERSFFDSLFEGSDDEFIVLVDGDEPTFTEINTNTQSRTLSIEVPSGTEEIEIIGSVFGQPEIEPVEEIPEPVEEIPEPVEEIPEPVEEIPEPVEEIPESLGIAAFVDPNQDPQSYVDRYNNEPTYKEWFDDNYSEYTSIYQAVGLEEPLEETSELIDDDPKTQCGPGTVLKDGVCALDERCGPGTFLVDGVCTLMESTSQSTDTSVKGLGKELAVGIIVTFVIAGIIGIIVAIMSKATKNKD